MQLGLGITENLGGGGGGGGRSISQFYFLFVPLFPKSKWPCSPKPLGGPHYVVPGNICTHPRSRFQNPKFLKVCITEIFRGVEGSMIFKSSSFFAKICRLEILTFLTFSNI